MELTVTSEDLPSNQRFVPCGMPVHQWDERELTLGEKIIRVVAVPVILPIIAFMFLLIFAGRFWKVFALLGVTVLNFLWRFRKALALLSVTAAIAALIYVFPNVFVVGLLSALIWARYS